MFSYRVTKNYTILHNNLLAIVQTERFNNYIKKKVKYTKVKKNSWKDMSHLTENEKDMN